LRELNLFPIVRRTIRSVWIFEEIRANRDNDGGSPDLSAKINQCVERDNVALTAVS
jgi:hypothetical protein